VACLLALYALCGAGGARGMVLCIEADGRLAVEGGFGCADACAAEDGGLGSEDDGPDLHECPCTDIPLAPAGAHVRAAGSDLTVPPAAPAVAPELGLAPSSPPAVPAARTAHDSPRRESRLRITTVVLRA
jgi:hypothetical protein